MFKRILSATFALALALGLAACGNGTTTPATSSAAPSTGGTTASSPAASSPASDEHNAVDIMFVTMMIPHHQGAIEMSDVALGQASTQPVKDLAGRIKAAQGPEIEQMQGWLADWDATMPMASTAEDMGHGMGHGSATESAPGPAVDDFGMGTMMNMGEADMAGLRAASGVAFDKLFLQQMIAHHQGAVDMADVEMAQGVNPQALALAAAIRTSQTAEIAEMQQLMSTL